MAGSSVASTTTDFPAEVVVLERNFSYLVETIDANAILPEALSEQLITSRQHSESCAEADVYKKAERFLGQLQRKVKEDNVNFHTFLQVLSRTGHESIARRLRGT